MDEDPQVLSDCSTEVVEASALSQLWHRIHCISFSLDSQDRSLSNLQGRVADQQCKQVTLTSLVLEVQYQISIARRELDQLQNKLQTIEDRLAKCETCLNLNSLD